MLSGVSVAELLVAVAGHGIYLSYYISSFIRQSCFPSKTIKNLYPFYKTDLDLWNCLGMVKFIL